MTIDRKILETVLRHWFRDKKNADKAKDEILSLFSEEPERHTWTEQDIYE